MAIKRLRCRERVRRVPAQFSGVDQRLVREQHIERCDVHSLARYRFLVTVAKWMGIAQYRPRQSAPRASQLDPYQRQVVRLLETHSYSAQQILQRLREDGFSGGYTIVKDYVRRVRPPRREAFLRLSFAPGECAQVDWGEYGTIAVGSTRRRLSFFLMVLCYSRLMYVEFTVSQTMEHFLACHEHAFAAMQGVPTRIMEDNLKSAVLQRLGG